MVKKKHRIWKRFFSMFLCLTLIVPLWWIQAEDADAAFSNTIAAVWNQAVADFEWADTGLTPWNGQSSGTSVPTADAKVVTVEGNEVDAYEIYTPEQFRWAMVNKRNMKLMTDLDMGGQAGKSWGSVSCVGSNTTHWVIEGNNHIIYNINMSGDGIFSNTTSNRYFFMKNLTIKKARNTTSGSYHSIIGRTHMGTYYNVGLEDAIVRGTSFNGGFISNNPTSANAQYPLVLDNCYTKNVTAYSSGQCIASLVCCTSNIEVTNSYAIDGSVIAEGTAGHSGAFVSCIYQGGKVENCFSNVDAYAQRATGAFIGVVHAVGSSSTFDISNNYASGKIQGNSALGGFIGGNQDAQSGYINVENCYSTAGVGLDDTASTLGGFHGVGTIGASSTSNRYYSYKNCYMAGEVGTESTSTTSGSVYAVSATSVSNGEKYDGMYYDKQTTGMKGRASAANRSGIHGMLTKDLMETRIDGKSESSSEWVLSDGAYPQLKVFTNPDTFVREEGKAIAKAYSQASVSTAILYPSNLEDSKYAAAVAADESDYDTVRSIRYTFPLTNNNLIGTGAGSFDMTWQTDGATSPITKLAGIEVITLSDYPDYEVIGTAPGVSTLSVEAALTDGSGIVGKRNQRLIPRNAFILSDMNRAIYHVRDDTARNVWETDTSGARDHLYYNMKIGIMFSYVNEGNPITDQYVTVEDLDDSGTAVWVNGTDAEGDYYYLDNPSAISSMFTGNIKVYVEDKNGNNVSIDDDLTKLLQGERTAKLEEVENKYMLHYKWYNEGFNKPDAVIERTRRLDIKLAPEVTYHYYVIDNQGSLDKDYIYKYCGPYLEGEKAKDMNIDAQPNDPRYEFKGWAWLDRLEDLTGDPADFDNTNPAWYDPASDEDYLKLNEDKEIWAVYELIYLGSLSLDVSDTAIYGTSEADGGGNAIRNSLMKFPATQMELGVIDDRITGQETWHLTATLTENFINLGNTDSLHAGHTLNHALVYSKGGNETTMELGEEVTILNDQHNSSNSTSEGYYDVYGKWYDNSADEDGLYVKVRPGDVKTGTYRASIKWKLTDAP